MFDVSDKTQQQQKAIYFEQLTLKTLFFSREILFLYIILPFKDTTFPPKNGKFCIRLIVFFFQTKRSLISLRPVLSVKQVSRFNNA